jgi:hypothetical protein
MMLSDRHVEQQLFKVAVLDELITTELVVLVDGCVVEKVIVVDAWVTGELFADDDNASIVDSCETGELFADDNNASLVDLCETGELFADDDNASTVDSCEFWEYVKLTNALVVSISSAAVLL